MQVAGLVSPSSLNVYRKAAVSWRSPLIPTPETPCSSLAYSILSPRRAFVVPAEAGGGCHDAGIRFFDLRDVSVTLAAMSAISAPGTSIKHRFIHVNGIKILINACRTSSEVFIILLRAMRDIWVTPPLKQTSNVVFRKTTLRLATECSPMI
jgi:hypothetical protein